MKAIDDTGTPEQIHDGARAVIKVAESLAENPSIAATMITDAVLLYAANQDDAEGALALQIDFLMAQLTKWLTEDEAIGAAKTEAHP